MITHRLLTEQAAQYQLEQVKRLITQGHVRTSSDFRPSKALASLSRQKTICFPSGERLSVRDPTPIEHEQNLALNQIQLAKVQAAAAQEVSSESAPSGTATGAGGEKWFSLTAEDYIPDIDFERVERVEDALRDLLELESDYEDFTKLEEAEETARKEDRHPHEDYEAIGFSEQFVAYLRQRKARLVEVARGNVNKSFRAPDIVDRIRFVESACGVDIPLDKNLRASASCASAPAARGEFRTPPSELTEPSTIEKAEQVFARSFERERPAQIALAAIKLQQVGHSLAPPTPEVLAELPWISSGKRSLPIVTGRSVIEAEGGSTLKKLMG